MGKPVTSYFCPNIALFDDIFICGDSIRDILVQWEVALSIDENVYENLVRVFYSNMDLSATRQIKILTFVDGGRIKFDEVDLCSIFGIQYGGLDIYTTRKELDFNDVCHLDGVQNICRRRDLSDDLCSLSFRSQLLPFQVRILHSIL